MTAIQGIEEMQLIARVTVYWPGIDADIVNYVKIVKLALNTRHVRQYNQCYPEVSQMAKGKI